MKRLKDRIIEETLFYTGTIVGIAGTLYIGKVLLDSLVDNYQKPLKQVSIVRNVLDVSNHASREIATDMDYDGKIDVLEREDQKGHFLFYKKGYGPSQSIAGIEIKIVDEKFFEDYDKAHFQRMVKGYYDITNSGELNNNK